MLECQRPDRLVSDMAVPGIALPDSPPSGRLPAQRSQAQPMRICRASIQILPQQPILMHQHSASDDEPGENTCDDDGDGH